MTIDAPNAGTANNLGTIADSISPSGMITGYFTAKPGSVLLWHGYILKKP